MLFILILYYVFHVLKFKLLLFAQKMAKSKELSELTVNFIKDLSIQD